MDKTSLSTPSIVELRAWADRTVLINDQHKEEIIVLCTEWLRGHGYCEPKTEKPKEVFENKITITPMNSGHVIRSAVESDPFLRKIDEQVAAINAARAARGPVKKQRKQRSDKGKPRLKALKTKTTRKIRRKKS